MQPCVELAPPVELVPSARVPNRRACARVPDRKSTRLNSSHDQISYAVFCLKKKKILTMKFAKPDYKMLFLGGLLSALFYTLSLWFLQLCRQEAHIGWRATPRPRTGTTTDD